MPIYMAERGIRSPEPLESVPVFKSCLPLQAAIGTANPAVSGVSLTRICSAMYFILQGQYVLQGAFVGLGPQVLITAGFHQLRSDAHAVRTAGDRALHDRVHPQIAANLRQGFLGPRTASPTCAK